MCTHAAAQDWAGMYQASGRAEDFRTASQAGASVPPESELEAHAVKRAAQCLHKLDYDISHLLTKLSVLSTAEMSAAARAKSGAMLLRDFCDTTAVVANICEVERPIPRDFSMAGCSNATASSARSTLAEILERDSPVRGSDVAEDSNREQSVTNWMSGTSISGAPRDYLSKSYLPGPNTIASDRSAGMLGEQELLGSSVERVGVLDVSTGTTIRVLGGVTGRKMQSTGRTVLQTSDLLDRELRGMRDCEDAYLSKLAESPKSENRPLVGASRLSYMSYWMHARAV